MAALAAQPHIRTDAQQDRVRGYTPTDGVFLLYLAANTGIVLWHAGDISSWPLLLLGNALAVVLVGCWPARR